MAALLKSLAPDYGHFDGIGTGITSTDGRTVRPEKRPAKNVQPPAASDQIKRRKPIYKVGAVESFGR